MPTYEYKCRECGHLFDKFQQMKEKPLTECPECGGALQRLLSGGAGVIMKGGSVTPSRPSCGRDVPCCGASEPCGMPPCDE